MENSNSVDSTKARKEEYDILVVGSGHAGVQAVTSLRQGGFEGSIAIVTADNSLPYDRPSLSKDYLMGKKTADQILLNPVTYWAARKVDLLLGLQVVAVDPNSQKVELADGGTIGYGKLIWAAGGTARRLSIPGADLEGIFYLRTLSDADKLKAAAGQAETVCIIGAGYIGLEAAAALSAAGKRVIVIEAAKRVLSRVAGKELSDFYYSEHVARGVDIHLETPVNHIEGRDGKVTGVSAGGQVFPCDIVIAGIGLEPSTAPLASAGAAGSNGVRVDEYCQTSLPNIFAIGDCSEQISPFAGNTHVRLESVQNATDQAKTVVRSILGNPVPHHATPWFWSTQYDLRLQTIGLSTGYDQVALRGDITRKSFSVIYLRKGQVIALDCVNATKDYVQGRKLVEASVSVDPGKLADDSIPLKTLVTDS